MFAALVLCATLIPRDVLFGAPDRLQPQLSPDGTTLAWLAPGETKGGNVWVGSKTITHQKKKLFYFSFAPDGRHVLFFEDGDGDENDHLFSAAIDGSEVRDLTPFRGVRAQNLITSAARTDEVLVALNLRDRKVFDLYRVNLRSGAIAIAAKNPGDVLSWTADASLAVRAATVFDQKSGRTIIRVKDRELISWPFESSPFF